jgi:ASPM-SPD-2-Hydin domain-containing protein/WD40 repeat protein
MQERFINYKGVIAGLASVALVATGLLAAPAAQAVRPGANGRIAFLNPAGCPAAVPLVTDPAGVAIIVAQGYNLAWKSPDGSGSVHTLTSTCDYITLGTIFTGGGFNRGGSDPNGSGGPSWNPTGTALVAHRTGISGTTGIDGLWVVPVDGVNGGSPFQIFQDPPTGPTGAGTSHDPAWSPDGTVVAFAVNTGSGSPAHKIFTVPAGGGGSISTIAETLSGSFADDPAYDPTGACVAFVERDAGGMNPIETQCSGSGAVMRTDLTPEIRNSPTWSPDGSRIAFDIVSYPDTCIPNFPPNYCIPPVTGLLIAYVVLGNTSETDIFGSQGVFDPVYSPDGTKLAVDNGRFLSSLGIITGPVTGGIATSLDPIPGAVQPDWESVGGGGACQPTSDDADHDGIANANDNDSDNDGVLNASDNDDDNDGVADAADSDDDNDGCPDTGVTVDLSSLDFGTVAVGASATRTVTLTNTGHGAKTISSVTVTGTTAFTVTANTCGASLAAGASCTMTVTFTPTTTAAVTGQLVIGDPIIVNLTGNASNGNGNGDGHHKKPKKKKKKKKNKKH